MYNITVEEEDQNRIKTCDFRKLKWNSIIRHWIKNGSREKLQLCKKQTRGWM